MALWRSVVARGLTIAIASACELIQCAVHMHSIGVAGAEEIGCDIVNSTASGGTSFLRMPLSGRSQSLPMLRTRASGPRDASLMAAPP